MAAAERPLGNLRVSSFRASVIGLFGQGISTLIGKALAGGLLIPAAPELDLTNNEAAYIA